MQLAANRERQQTPAGKANHDRAVKAYRARNRHKLAAHNAVNKALMVGSLVRWPCQVCGQEPAQAHHPDYENRLGVVWLCDGHHKQVHLESK